MRTAASLAQTHPHLLSLDRFCRRSRFVEVRVLRGERELDAVRASNPESLRASLRLIYRHLTSFGAVVEFTGTEERHLPMGIRRSREDMSLASLGEAIEFLAGR